MHLELVIVDGPQAGRRFSLGRTPVTFGRSAGATVSFPQDSFMSGMHLSVQYALSCIIVVDLRSSNGTFMNDQRIRQAMAVPGDLIRIGSMTMQLVIGKPPVTEAPQPEALAPEALALEPIAATVLEVPIPTLPELSVEEADEQEIEPVAAPLEAPPAEPGEKVHQSVLTWLLDTRLPLFCLVDPGADAVIPSLLEHSSEPKESLFDGDADNMMSKFAPYITQLGPDSTLLHELVDQGWGQGWACFFTSEAPLEELSRHFRKFFMVQLEGGKEVYFRFYDPRVLRAFLPAGSAEELTAFFGPVVEWLLEAKNSAMMLKFRNASDGLHTKTLPLAVTASRLRKHTAS